MTTRILSRIEVAADAPKLTDYHDASEDVTVELRIPDEWFAEVKADARDASVTCPLKGGVK
jgi:hypothetical protein